MSSQATGRVLAPVVGSVPIVDNVLATGVWSVFTVGRVLELLVVTVTIVDWVLETVVGSVFIVGKMVELLKPVVGSKVPDPVIGGASVFTVDKVLASTVESVPTLGGALVVGSGLTVDRVRELVVGTKLAVVESEFGDSLWVWVVDETCVVDFPVSVVVSELVGVLPD